MKRTNTASSSPDSERCLRAFASLGRRLGAASTVGEAATIIMEVADELLGWDACTFNVYSAQENKLYHVLSADLADGRRVMFSPGYDGMPPSSLAGKAIKEGPQLILRKPGAKTSPAERPFGDKSRRSASLMFVPIRNRHAVTGLMSIQSYTAGAYNQKSLEVLESLADHCGGALDRIRAGETLGAAEEQLRQVQKMEAVGQLAGGVAHDFNNLLTVIRGNSELLLLDEKNLPAPARESIKQVVDAAARASDLTRQLLVFSRRQALQLRAVSVNEAVRGMTAMISRLIGREIQVRSTCADGLPMIQADAAMVDQLLLNLLVNGRDAMPQGGELWISTSVTSFNGRSITRHPEARAGQFIKLSICDSGTGIAPEHLPHIFEPFFTTKETGKGTGLGLAIVYGIVKQHQGWIEVASELGKGTTFDVYLPATAGVPAGAPVAAPKVAGGSEMILMVEDEESVRVLARRMLENAGYSVHAAASGAAAFDLWKKHGRKVDLLLADFMLPDGVNGYDLAEKFRALKPNLKVILTSGYSPDELGTGSARDGAVFLPKPFSMRVLLQTVRRSLDNQLDAAQ